MWYTFCAKPMILIDRIVTLRCRSPCGERGLKLICQDLFNYSEICRSPCGERGLKSNKIPVCVRVPASLPVRGAWIEISTFGTYLQGYMGRSPCGERGLKYRETPFVSWRCERRSPCGERGLKSCTPQPAFPQARSLPVRGAWIEIPLETGRKMSGTPVAPRAGSVD